MLFQGAVIIDGTSPFNHGENGAHTGANGFARNVPSLDGGDQPLATITRGAGHFEIEPGID